MGKQYRVTAPYVTLTQRYVDGDRIVGLGVDALVDGDAIPDWQLKHHLDNGLLEECPDPTAAPSRGPSAPAEPEDDKPRVERPAPVPVGRQQPDRPPAAPEQPEPPTPPATNAPKADWVDYAVAQGEDRSKAEGMSKEQLVGKYGKRG